MAKVLIRGGGVAASCCARLLSRSGVPFVSEAVKRPTLPAIMMSDTTQKLFADLFERNDLFEGVPRIRNRVVAWGANAKPLMLPHNAVVMSEQMLLERIQSRHGHDEGAAESDCAWTIVTSRPLPATSVEHHFGSRTATASEVKLEPKSNAETCWVESLPNGWLFLLPAAHGSETMLFTTSRAAPRTATSSSTNVRPKIRMP